MRKIICFLGVLLMLHPIVLAEKVELIGEFPPTSAMTLNLGDNNALYRSRSAVSNKFECTLSGFTAEQEAAFQYALELWSQVLPADAKISIHASFTGNATNAYSVPLTYIKKGNIAYPLSLYNHKHSTDALNEPSIVIKFCSDLSKWDFSTDHTADIENGKYDFVTHALRAIAKGLGFTSSLTGSTATTIAHKASVFDSYVRNEANKRLNKLENKSDELLDFVCGDTYFALENYSNYRLYTNSTYNKNLSCSYFAPDVTIDTEKALMYPEINGRCHFIGSKIIDVLSSIGWKQINPIIATDDVNEAGIVQYDPEKEYEFYTVGIDVQNPTWRFEIYQTDQTLRQVASSSDATFQLSLPSEFYNTDARTEDGFVRCRISVSGRDSNRNAVSAVYYLLVEFRPPAPQIWLISSEPNGDRYKVTLGMYSYGATRYHIDLLEGMFIVSDWVQQPENAEYAEYVMDHIINGSYYRIEIKALNDYGYSDVSSYELSEVDLTSPVTEPILLNNNPLPEAGVEEVSSTEQKVISINYYNINGSLIYNSDYDAYNALAPGVYIKELIFESGKKSQTKIVK